ncbi:hypothetical protein AC578_9580 [Pseudocercospora eumusae]|uniref:Uncharacterized protein n=1 Tax=Pseudocercospora eumusae TaxID=321146 RepID=A0A139GY69_9PEZI|nr:hypothetical protein AC578_9580 [Pseudocercospora eumusae]
MASLITLAAQTNGRHLETTLTIKLFTLLTLIHTPSRRPGRASSSSSQKPASESIVTERPANVELETDDGKNSASEKEEKQEHRAVLDELKASVAAHARSGTFARGGSVAIKNPTHVTASSSHVADPLTDPLQSSEHWQGSQGPRRCLAALASLFCLPARRRPSPALAKRSLTRATGRPATLMWEIS